MTPAWPIQVGSGLTAGLAIGVSARVFMRLVSDDPEFSWSGTLFIVGLFATFGFVQGIVAAVRSRTTRRWINGPVRVLGGVSYLSLGGGAGMLMLPLLWCGGLTYWRSTWRRPVRVILALLGVGNLVAVFALTVSDTGLHPSAVAGLVVLTITYAAAIHLVGPTLRKQPSGTTVGRRALTPGR